jgi:hypothetical protein
MVSFRALDNAAVVGWFEAGGTPSALLLERLALALLFAAINSALSTVFLVQRFNPTIPTNPPTPTSSISNMS